MPRPHKRTTQEFPLLVPSPSSGCQGTPSEPWLASSFLTLLGASLGSPGALGTQGPGPEGWDLGQGPPLWANLPELLRHPLSSCSWSSLSSPSHPTPHSPTSQQSLLLKTFGGNLVSSKHGALRQEAFPH